MIIKVNFVQDKRSLRDENNFMNHKKVQMRVMIEDAYIIGFLSHDGPKGTMQDLDMDMGKELFYNYDKLEQNNLVDPKLVQKVLMEKYDMRAKEMGLRNGMLDEEGQDFHKTLPNLYDYSTITGTRTIFDDMNEKKIFY